MKPLPSWCCSQLEEKITQLKEVPYTVQVPDSERGLYVSLGILEHLGYDVVAFYQKVEQVNLERMKKCLDF